MGADAVVLAVNGEKVAVPQRVDLNTSLADFIRTETRYKVILRAKRSPFMQLVLQAAGA